MMVTEFAPCGSLMDCIKKRGEPDDRVKAKLMLDAAMGLESLHGNWILHRDIKPDNVLVFSLDGVITVNGKLTDFGSSRNVNVLMTNMTFTKGIGSPTYMAPEVLGKEKYKKAADYFSFGVTMFECFKWGEAYPKSVFKYLGTSCRLSRRRSGSTSPLSWCTWSLEIFPHFLITTPWALLGLSSMTGTTLGFCFNLL